MSHNVLAFSETILDSSLMLSLLSIDAAEIIHIRPVEEGKKEYYVHYHGCKWFSFTFLLANLEVEDFHRIFAQIVRENSLNLY